MDHIKKVIAFALVVLMMACNYQQSARNSIQSDSSAGTTGNDDQLPESEKADAVLRTGSKSPEWLEEVIKKYLNGTDNQLIKSIGADNESWIIDNINITDRGKYISIRIGHDVKETDGSEPRFITDQWIGVDSQTRTIYEYDVVNDTSTVWVKK